MKCSVGILVITLLSLTVTAGTETKIPGTPVSSLHDTDAWCPSGDDLDSYLEARSQLPGKRGAGPFVDALAAPVVIPRDGVLVIEDSGVILKNDRVLDLPMDSIEFIPSGDGYQISFIPPA